MCSDFWDCGWNPRVWPFKWKLLSSTFLWCCLLWCTRWFYLFESVDEILKCDYSNESYWAVVVFIMLYLVVLTHASVDEILKCDHSNESYWAVLSYGAVCYAVQGSSNFWVCGWNPSGVWPFKWKLLSSTFVWRYFLGCTRWF